MWEAKDFITLDMMFSFIAGLTDCATGRIDEAQMTKVHPVHLDLAGRLSDFIWN